MLVEREEKGFLRENFVAVPSSVLGLGTNPVLGVLPFLAE